MEYRKLISFGKSSFVISLPKAWLQKNKLKKGEVIYITEEANNLMISPNMQEGEPEEREMVIDTEGKSIDDIKREITSLYIANFGTLIITGKDLSDKAKKIRNILQNLMAFEIMEQTSNKIIAKDFLDIKSISIPQLIKKMDIITRAMMDDSKNTLSDDKTENIFHRDEDVNRLSHMLNKVIRKAFRNSSVAKTLKMDSLKLLANWWAIICIEKVADEAKRIAEALSEISKKKNPKPEFRRDLIKLYSEVQEFYTDMMKAFFDFDAQAAFDIAQKKYAILKDCRVFMEKHPCVAESPAEKLETMTLNIHNIGRAIYTN